MGAFGLDECAKVIVTISLSYGGWEHCNDRQNRKEAGAQQESRILVGAQPMAVYDISQSEEDLYASGKHGN